VLLDSSARDIEAARPNDRHTTAGISLCIALIVDISQRGFRALADVVKIDPGMTPRQRGSDG